MARPPAKAQALADALAEEIIGGTRRPESWLPSERDLAEAHGLDRSTVRRALQMLENRGLVTLRPGMGAQVAARGDATRRDTADITSSVGDWRGFHVSATRAGRTPYTETDVNETDLDINTARWLGVPTGTRVIERARLQGVEGVPPIQLSTTWILPEVTERLPILRQVDTGPGGMLTRMEELAYDLRFEDAVTGRLPHTSEQDRLQIGAYEPVFDVWQRCYDKETNRVVKVTRRIIVCARQDLFYSYDAHT